MPAYVIAIIVIAAVIVLAAIAFAVWQYMQKRQDQQLQSRYGAEYDRMKEEHGSDAGSVLKYRQQKVEQYDVRQLSPDEQQKFSGQWTAIQAKFVDKPAEALKKADGLIREVMVTVGYPAGSFEQREEAASVKYPDVVNKYRDAHQITEATDQAQPNSTQNGQEQNGRAGTSQASTEDMRKAMVMYRSLFERLVGVRSPDFAAASTS